MSSFWPEGIALTDTQSPREILQKAQEDWQLNSNGIMELVLQESTSEVDKSVIIVHAKHTISKHTATLFSVVHRSRKPYPVTIRPEVEELPNFLKKSYQKTTKSPFSASLEMVKADLVESIDNPWVSDTPAEFRKTLSDVFNLGGIKSIILNLASIATEGANDTDDALQEEAQGSS